MKLFAKSMGAKIVNFGDIWMALISNILKDSENGIFTYKLFLRHHLDLYQPKLYHYLSRINCFIKKIVLKNINMPGLYVLSDNHC